MQYTRKKTFGQKVAEAFSSVTSNRPITILSLLVIVAALPVTLFLINNQTQQYGHAAGGLGGFSFIASVDTMKESKDGEKNGMTNAQIADDVNLAAGLHTTHITVDTKYDYPTVMAQWVQAIRATGKHVWFRPGGFVAGLSTLGPSTYLSQMSNFIISNPGLFRSGDIFDGDPEAENSAYWGNTYGSNWSSTQAGRDAFNQFMVNLTNTANSAFQQIGVQGITTTIHSIDPWDAQNLLYPSTVQAMGDLITLDAYPDQNTTDPTAAANAWVNQLTSLYNAWQSKGLTVSILIGEMGYCNNIDVDDSIQEAVISAELMAISPMSYVPGINYWVGAGGAGYGGYTNIFSGSSGNWSLRSAAYDLSGFYATKTQNTSTNTATSTFTPTPISSDTLPPTVTILSPLNGSTVSRHSNVTVTASASDDIGVTQVSFSINGSLLCTTATSPYTCSWSVPRKRHTTYTITATAYDVAGLRGTNSVTVTAN